MYHVATTSHPEKSQQELVSTHIRLHMSECSFVKMSITICRGASMRNILRHEKLKTELLCGVTFIYMGSIGSSPMPISGGERCT